MGGCSHARHEVRKRQFCNGSEHAGWFCLECRRFFVKAGERGMWLPKTRFDLADLPLEEYGQQEVCGHCGETLFCEEHHYGPRNNFGRDDAELWPKGWLCVDCHELWHARMNQPIRQARTGRAA